MTRYLLQRGIASVLVAIGVVTVAFLLIRIGGDPIDLMLPTDAPPETRAALRDQLGLNDPLPVQYWRWLTAVTRGDLGQSILTREPVSVVVFRRLGPTYLLATTALAISTAAGILLGLAAATRPRTWVDRGATIFATLGVSLPSFWLGLLLVAGFAVNLKWLPTGGMMSPRNPDPRDIPVHLILPALTLALPSIAVIARLTRSSLLEVLGVDYIRTARSKGLPERLVLLRHALKNALIPVVTILGLQVGNLFGGAIIVEAIFSWPGVGTLLLDGIFARDYPVVQGAVLYVSLSFVLVTLAVDLLYAYLNPRVRYA